jgi:hypothetical protein
MMRIHAEGTNTVTRHIVATDITNTVLSGYLLRLKYYSLPGIKSNFATAVSD